MTGNLIGRPPWFACVADECAAARNAVALFDESLFGKILVEVIGLLIRFWGMVVPHHWYELVHIGGHEGVGMLKALAARPSIEGAYL